MLNRVFKLRRQLLKRLQRIIFPVISESNIETILDKLSINKGDYLYIHSSSSMLCSLKPTSFTTSEFILKIIEQIKQRVGSEGVIMMPSFTIAGRSMEFWENHPIFSPELTPGNNGYFNELFRNESNDTKRSNHPSESVATWGNIPQEILYQHYKYAITPDDPRTPMGWMIDRNAKIIHFGVRFTKSITLIHYIDSVLNRYKNFGYLSKKNFKATVLMKNKHFDIEGKAYNSNLTKFYDRRILYKEMNLKSLISFKYRMIHFSVFNAQEGFNNAIISGKSSLNSNKLPNWIKFKSPLLMGSDHFR